jgi:CBS domain-containing protein
MNLRTALATLVAEHADALVVVGEDDTVLGSVTKDDILG